KERREKVFDPDHRLDEHINKYSSPNEVCLFN
ncbi:unnamed protein product, partial [Rotaria sp. Silwood2]